MNTTNRIAVREYLATGAPITEIESCVLFGVTSLPGLLSIMRKEGYVFGSRKTTYAAALRRINEFATLVPPDNLPVREINLTEWWISQ